MPKKTLIERLRELVTAASERALDALAISGERLAFSRPGLRIYRKTDGTFRVTMRPNYVGPDPHAWVAALAELEAEKEMVLRVEQMTDEQRAAMLREHDGITAAMRQSVTE